MAELKVMNSMDVKSENVTTEGAVNTKIRWLIAKEDGAENFFMRIFELERGGKTPLHSHDWEHEIFILSGEGTLTFEGSEYRLKPGYFAFVPPNREHSFMNNGDEPFVFICLVPAK